jgi:hypothetical protein
MDPSENYRMLVETINFLENRGRVTEDWVEHHKKVIARYRDAFPNFEDTNPEVDNSYFRDMAKQAEILITFLMREICLKNGIHLREYLLFCKTIRTMCEFLFDEEDLASMLSDMEL